MKIKLTLLFLLLTGFVFSQTQSEEILLKNDSIELPGTLTFTKENSPLLIWVHGSGNIDRNGNQLPVIKADYIKQFRDSVTKKGIAFYSYDKRTAVAKNIKYLKETVFEDFVADLQIVIDYFKLKKHFSSITLIGHSQGALTAMLATKSVDKYISLAGTSRAMDKIMEEQIAKNSPMALDTVKAYFKELRATGTLKYVNPFLKSLFAKQNLAFINSWMQYVPVKEIKKIAIPILIINGTKDLQVPVSDARALHKSNPKSELVIIENMNHLLKHIEKDADNLKSYYSPDYPLSSELITVITTFVVKSK